MDRLLPTRWFVWLWIAVALFTSSPLRAARLLNIQCGDAATHARQGVAAVGLSDGDQWNLYSPHLPPAALTNLLFSDGLPSGIGLSVSNAVGSWSNGASDELGLYLYPYNKGNIDIQLSRVPPGKYDLVVYGHGGPQLDRYNGIYTAATSGQRLGPLATSTGSDWQQQGWAEGGQYVRFRGVIVGDDGRLGVVGLPGEHDGRAVFNGLQLIAPDETVDDRLETLINIQFGEAADLRKTGTAAVGRRSDDHWNFYSGRGPNGFKEIGSLNTLLAFDRQVTGARMTIRNAAGLGKNGVPDPMFGNYLYSPGTNRNLGIEIHDLFVGLYDLYLYGHGGPRLDLANSVFTAEASGEKYGPRATVQGPGWTNSHWMEGQQYVVLQNVLIAKPGDILAVKELPGADGRGFINGMQILKKPDLVPPSAALVNIQFSAAGLPRKSGKAAVGHSSGDVWNWIEPLEKSERPLVYADGNLSGISLAITNVLGVWGNGDPDPMFGHYAYPPEGGFIRCRLSSLPVGEYEFYLYGHGGDEWGVANTLFSIHSLGATYGPLFTAAEGQWRGVSWRDGRQYVAIRGVTITENHQSVEIDAEGGVSGSAFFSGMQIVRRIE
ncbi:MAG TPA: hypothetical protein VMF06_19835 [Candidatus Limnocylindria bacterium]|jgi:hypothetical protein|nr:hypothetical protein [Candidatus Limnocylindria bacterium]